MLFIPLKTCGPVGGGPFRVRIPVLLEGLLVAELGPVTEHHTVQRRPRTLAQVATHVRVGAAVRGLGQHLGAALPCRHLQQRGAPAGHGPAAHRRLRRVGTGERHPVFPSAPRADGAGRGPVPRRNAAAAAELPRADPQLPGGDPEAEGGAAPRERAQPAAPATAARRRLSARLRSFLDRRAAATLRGVHERGRAVVVLGVPLRPRRHERRDRRGVAAVRGEHERRHAVDHLGLHLRPRRQERLDRRGVAALRGLHERREAVLVLGVRVGPRLEKRGHHCTHGAGGGVVQSGAPIPIRGVHVGASFQFGAHLLCRLYLTQRACHGVRCSPLRAGELCEPPTCVRTSS